MTQPHHGKLPQTQLKKHPKQTTIALASLPLEEARRLAKSDAEKSILTILEEIRETKWELQREMEELRAEASDFMAIWKEQCTVMPRHSFASFICVLHTLRKSRRFCLGVTMVKCTSMFCISVGFWQCCSGSKQRPMLNMLFLRTSQRSKKPFYVCALYMHALNHKL